MSTNIAKIELSFEPELNFCNFGGLENEPPRALWTPRWVHVIPKSRQVFPKMRQDFTKSSKMLARTAADMQMK